MKRRIRRWYGPPLPSRFRVARVNTDTRFHVIDTRTGRTILRTVSLTFALRTARHYGAELAGSLGEYPY